MAPATLYALTHQDRIALMAALRAIPGVSRAAATALTDYSHVAAAALAAYHTAVEARNTQRLRRAKEPQP